MRKRMCTAPTENNVINNLCINITAKNMLSLPYPVFTANTQFCLYCKCKTTLLVRDQYMY